MGTKAAMRSDSHQYGRKVARHVRNGAPALAFTLTLGAVGAAPALADVPTPASNERWARITLASARLAGAYAERSEIRKRTARIKAIMMWQERANEAIHFASQQRGKPYIWGGTGPRGYDCSGLVWQAWRRAGVQLPRTARAQYSRLKATGKEVDQADLRPGDLVFFHRLRHVGMYLGNRRFIHSSRRGVPVGERSFDSYYQRSFVGAVRPGWPSELGPPS